jgi:hypothetical protein
VSKLDPAIHISLNLLHARLARTQQVEVVNRLVSGANLTCAYVSKKDKKVSVKLNGYGDVQVSFNSFDWLKYFDENRPLWPLALHAVYFQITEKQATHRLLGAHLRNGQQESFLCKEQGMGTLCKFGDFMGRIYGEEMVAINVFNNKDVGPKVLWNVVEPILNTVKDVKDLKDGETRKAVTVWRSNKPKYDHKYITQVTGVQDSTQGSTVTYFNPSGDESHTSLNDVIGSKPYSWDKKGNHDSTFFILPLSQYLHQTPPTGTKPTLAIGR